MDNRKVSLIKNTTILALGNFSSRILSFLLVPLYSFYLNPSDFGAIDLQITFLSMLYIIVSLQSIESSFRFIQDCKTDQEKKITFSNALITSLIGIGIFSVVMLIIELLLNFEYTIIFILYVSTNILVNLFLHTLRGMNQMTIYAISGFISTALQFGCNILFIIALGMGSITLLVTPIITNFMVIIIIMFRTNLLNLVDFKTGSMMEIKKQLVYSLPLIPNALGLWLTASIGRFILLFYYGTTEVGLLAFTLKFPLLLATINSIFFMAWQMSAISEYHSKDRDKFASEVFQQFSQLLLSIILVMLPFTKIVIFTLMGDSYLETWMYIPIFFSGVIFNSYAQFFSMGFFGAKKTAEVFYSVVISCIAYIVVGLILGNFFYIFGIGIAYSFSMFIYWIYIKKRSEKYMKIDINYKQQFLFLAILLLFTLVYYIGGIKVQVISSLMGLIVALKSNSKLIRKLLSSINTKF